MQLALVAEFNKTDIFAATDRLPIMVAAVPIKVILALCERAGEEHFDYFAGLCAHAGANIRIRIQREFELVRTCIGGKLYYRIKLA